MVSTSYFSGREATEIGIVNGHVPMNSDNNAAFLKSLEMAEEILEARQAEELKTLKRHFLTL